MYRKKILAFEAKGSYGVLPVFFKEICDGFEKEGYLVQRKSIDTIIWEELRNIPYAEFEFIFCFNSAFYREISYLFPVSVITVAFFVDHPIIHQIRIKRNHCFNYLALNVDKYWVEFAKKHYLTINDNQFVPHAGSKAKNVVPYKQRKYDVVQIGGYLSSWQALQTIMRTRKEKHFNYSMKVIEIFLSQETISLEDAFAQVFAMREFTFSDQEKWEIEEKFYLEDDFIRAYAREMAIKSLLDAKIDVHVFGEKWDQFFGDNMEYLHIHGSISYLEALDVMANSKIVLNVTPTLNYGAHERIFSAMMNGAICLTNQSLYLKETGLDQELVIYSISEISDLPEMVHMLLSYEDQAEVISNRAMEIATKEHTWGNRAKKIIEIVNQYKTKRNYKDFQYANDCEMRFGEWCNYVRFNSESMLFSKIKNNYIEVEPNEIPVVERIFESYNRYGYWGRCDPHNGIFELFHNRVKEIKEHVEDFVWMFQELKDLRSKRALCNILYSWIRYSPQYLSNIKEHIFDQYFDMDLMQIEEDEVFVDVGAYHGDTALSYIQHYCHYKKIYCYEAFDKNMEICKNNLRGFSNIEYRECAVGKQNGIAYINISEDHSACTISDSDNGTRGIEIVSLDEDISDKITFIKMDIEGSEYNALLGAKRHIRNDHPKLAVAAYHNNQDLWRLAKIIKDLDDSYHFYLRYYGGVGYPSEYVLYGI